MIAMFKPTFSHREARFQPMLYEGSELLGAMGLFELHCSQRWAPRDSLSDTVVASSGNLLNVQYPRTVWLIDVGLGEGPCQLGLKRSQ